MSTASSAAMHLPQSTIQSCCCWAQKAQLDRMAAVTAYPQQRPTTCRSHQPELLLTGRRRSVSVRHEVLSFFQMNCSCHSKPHSVTIHPLTHPPTCRSPSLNLLLLSRNSGWLNHSGVSSFVSLLLCRQLCQVAATLWNRRSA